ncbi:hypothetical protein HY416_00210 [Candidatus Kaiserbacteria bacterium]|nr:hypothetical protein [Candidatus Kaiserbacteria bacterium]
MSTSKHIGLQIDNEISGIAAHQTLLVKGSSMARERLDNLIQAGFMIETIFVYAQLIEHLMKFVIDGYVARRRILKLLRVEDIFEDEKLILKDEETLGQLVGIFARLRCDRILIKNINKFNGIRREAVHHMFDGTKELKVFEAEVTVYLAGSEFNSIIEGITAEQMKLIQDIKKIVEIAGERSATN